MTLSRAGGLIQAPNRPRSPSATTAAHQAARRAASDSSGLILLRPHIPWRPTQPCMVAGCAPTSPSLPRSPAAALPPPYSFLVSLTTLSTGDDACACALPAASRAFSALNLSPLGPLPREPPDCCCCCCCAECASPEDDVSTSTPSTSIASVASSPLLRRAFKSLPAQRGRGRGREAERQGAGN